MIWKLMEKPLTVAVNNGFTLIENEERRCLMVERLMEEPEDALHFEDKTLIQVITDCHATNCDQIPTKASRSIASCGESD